MVFSDANLHPYYVASRRFDYTGEVVEAAPYTTHYATQAQRYEASTARAHQTEAVRPLTSSW